MVGDEGVRAHMYGFDSFPFLLPGVLAVTAPLHSQAPGAALPAQGWGSPFPPRIPPDFAIVTAPTSSKSFGVSPPCSFLLILASLQVVS